MNNDELALALARANRAESNYRRAVDTLNDEVKALEEHTNDVLQAARDIRAKRIVQGRPVQKPLDPAFSVASIDPERLYKPIEAAQILGITAGAVSTYIHLGNLKGVNVQKPGALRARWAITGATLSDYIARRRNRTIGRKTII